MRIEDFPLLRQLNSSSWFHHRHFDAIDVTIKHLSVCALFMAYYTGCEQLEVYKV